MDVREQSLFSAMLLGGWKVGDVRMRCARSFPRDRFNHGDYSNFVSILRPRNSSCNDIPRTEFVEAQLRKKSN